MSLGVMRVPDLVEVPDEVFAVRVEIVEAGVWFSELPEQPLPAASDPELVGIINGVARLMAQDHHDLFFGIGDLMPLGDTAELVVGKVEGDLDRPGPVDAAPGFLAEVEAGIKRDVIRH